MCWEIIIINCIQVSVIQTKIAFFYFKKMIVTFNQQTEKAAVFYFIWFDLLLYRNKTANELRVQIQQNCVYFSLFYINCMRIPFKASADILNYFPIFNVVVLKTAQWIKMFYLLQYFPQKLIKWIRAFSPIWKHFLFRC